MSSINKADSGPFQASSQSMSDVLENSGNGKTPEVPGTELGVICGLWMVVRHYTAQQRNIYHTWATTEDLHGTWRNQFIWPS